MHQATSCSCLILDTSAVARSPNPLSRSTRFLAMTNKKNQRGRKKKSRIKLLRSKVSFLLQRRIGFHVSKALTYPLIISFFFLQFSSLLFLSLVVVGGGALLNLSPPPPSLSLWTIYLVLLSLLHHQNMSLYYHHHHRHHHTQSTGGIGKNMIV